MKIIRAEKEKEIEQVKNLFKEYAKSFDFKLDTEDFKKELSTLPGRYSSPNGRLLLCRVDDEAVGCIALRRLSEDICEMKRMYVRPDFRGAGLGKGLAKAIINEARSLGYQKMRLSTIDSMQKAISIYKSLGFKEIEPYKNAIQECAVYMELDLS
ncbi:GNAT family N-acetyltransferase [Fuchsiella alkaliacetigena]|uniref:GNAT family N-acetyltransferase n=1 Tax=Fuchsiella alkaliacetigena TaxID=957042 RepID=UPI002009E4A0|nr:GNAT family N-acetyltransferase [Fuchsiella alkaliacetigena]MCK8823451.1 GNAT family N-acetyltransferase [Fuchsiella alkaliacetigena]